MYIIFELIMAEVCELDKFHNWASFGTKGLMLFDNSLGLSKLTFCNYCICVFLQGVYYVLSCYCWSEVVGGDGQSGGEGVSGIN